MWQRSVPEIGIERFAATRDQATLVDVREPHEYVAGHVPGALPIPRGQLAQRMAQLDKLTPVYVICASGHRSRSMTNLLRRAGFEAFSVAGGTKAWANSGHPVVGGRT